MANTTNPRKITTIRQGQKIFTNEQKNTRYVRQDGYAPRRVRVASRQALRITNNARTRVLNTPQQRVKKRSTRRRTVIAAGWVSKPISLQIDRVAADMGITRSKAIRFLIELGLANNILGDHLKVIIAAVRDATASELSKGLRRVDGNTARSAYFSAQNRHILTNMLSLLGLTEQEMEELIKESEERANTLLTTVPPQLKRLVLGIKAAQEEQDEEKRRK